jgi:hypothetical protein
MRTLRPHLEEEAEFVRRVDEVQRPEGYRLVGAFEDGRCLAVAGFRQVHSLAWGHVGCEQLHLDSGVEANRLDAHRLYLNTGMRITSFHFGKGIPR